MIFLDLMKQQISPKLTFMIVCSIIFYKIVRPNK